MLIRVYQQHRYKAFNPGIVQTFLLFDKENVSLEEIAFLTSHPLTDKHLDTSKSRCND